MQSVPSPWIRFTFNFYLFNQICHLDFSQFENQIQRDNTFYMVQFMDQSLEQRNSNKSLGDVQVPIKETDLINTNATITSLHPRMQAIWGDIWKHTVENSQKTSINASMHRSILNMQGLHCRRFNDAFANAHWRKVAQMWPLCLCWEFIWKPTQ